MQLQTRVLRQASEPSRSGRTDLWIKRGIWAYFWLLIFEGALRKWILPQLSAELLIIRDPVLIFVYWQAFRASRFRLRKKGLLIFVSLALILLTCAQRMLGIGETFAAAYGLRSYLLHLPLIFIIAETLDARDVKAFGRQFLLLSIPLGILIVAQFKAPPTAWVNVGADDTVLQQDFSMGHVRASATFSYVTGTQCFIPFVESFLLIGIFHPRIFPRSLVLLSAFATVVSLPVAGSRTAVFMTAGVLAFALPAAIRSLESFIRLSKILAVILIAAVAALQLPTFQDGLQAFNTRWAQGERDEGKELGLQGIVNRRVMGVITEGFESAQSVPLLGYGVGMGSNAAAALQTGQRDFTLAEMEWARVIMEFGPIFGLGFLLFRVLFSLQIIRYALAALCGGSDLSWLLVAPTVPILILNTMEQPTNLGFMVLGAGLCLAATKDRSFSRSKSSSCGPSILSYRETGVVRKF